MWIKIIKSKTPRVVCYLEYEWYKRRKIKMQYERENKKTNQTIKMNKTKNVKKLNKQKDEK